MHISWPPAGTVGFVLALVILILCVVLAIPQIHALPVLLALLIGGLALARLL